MTSISDPSSPDLPYRSCVGITLLNSDGKVLVGHRCDVEASWQMPQGGIRQDETIVAAARRELEQETGVTSIRMLAATSDWLRYDFPDFLVPRILDGRYRGQEQKWIAAQFTGDENEINLRASDHPEFDAWRWENLADLPSIVVPFKRKVYKAVVNAFRPFVDNIEKPSIMPAINTPAPSDSLKTITSNDDQESARSLVAE